MPVLHSAETAKDNITESEIAKAKTNEMIIRLRTQRLPARKMTVVHLHFSQNYLKTVIQIFLVSGREEPANFKGNCYGVAGKNVDHGQRENDLCMPEKPEVGDEIAH